MAHFKGIIMAKSGVATSAKPKPDTVAKKEPRKMINPAINKLDKSIISTSPSITKSKATRPAGSYKAHGLFLFLSNIGPAIFLAHLALLHQMAQGALKGCLADAKLLLDNLQWRAVAIRHAAIALH